MKRIIIYGVDGMLAGMLPVGKCRNFKQLEGLSSVRSTEGKDS